MLSLICVLILLAVQLFLLINLQFTAWPEMMSYPYLRNHGFLMYQDMIHPYPPLLTMGLSYVYQLFGHTLISLKIVSWVVSITSSILSYILLKHITKNNFFSLLGLGFYVLTQPFLEGNMLWFDNAIVPLILLGSIASLKYIDSKNIKWLVLAGLSISVAALIKQTAALFLIAFFIFLLLRKTNFKHLVVLCVTPFILLIPLTLRLLQEGALEWFINWTILYPSSKWSSYPNYVQMAINNRDMFVLQILLAPLIVFALFKRSLFKDKTFQFITLFLVTSLILIYPRFSFFHFQSALALTIVLWIYSSSKVSKNTTIVTVLCALLIIGVVVAKPMLAISWGKEARFAGEDDMKLASTIYSIAKQDKVFLQGLNSNLYTLSQTIPPEPWTDNFGWYLEVPGVQTEILERWEKNPPKYIFWRHSNPGNWFDLGTYEPKEFVEYYKLHYNLKEEVAPSIELWQRND